MDQEPSNTELMTAIVELHEAVTQGFAMVNARFDRLETPDRRLDALEGRRPTSAP
jgi:hypothetical protein